jgi:hypothetical protein
MADDAHSYCRDWSIQLFGNALCKWLRPAAHEDGLFLLFIVTWVIVGGAIEWRPRASFWRTDLGIFIGSRLLVAILGWLFWVAFDLPAGSKYSDGPLGNWTGKHHPEIAKPTQEVWSVVPDESLQEWLFPGDRPENNITP